MEPKRLKNWLIAFALLYLLFPRDLIPDFLGRGLGLIDDLALMAALVWFYRRHLRELATRAGAESARARDEIHHEPEKRSERAFDPHQILGISASSSREAIRNAYRARMSEYHPDKVAHLGEELQELAHRKALEIQEAYRQLTK